ncbi:MAG: recB [Deinococcus sp.]|nr:recB [Deinococcus sp.]
MDLVRVTFLEGQLAQALELNEEAGFLPTGSEAQMQETLAAPPELIEPGLRVLNRELLVESGGTDLYAQDAQGRFVVVELKRGRATQDAVSQLGRYVASVLRLVGKGGGWWTRRRRGCSAPCQKSPAVAGLLPVRRPNGGPTLH